jgi:2-polyprenyl-6-methoxyphenol hydroxylase-like FAD-dependent oxidoreductase
VAAILLAKRNISVTVMERSKTPDPWSTKSYSIVLGPRGMAALEKANCLQEARNAGMTRACIIFHNADGSTRVISKKATDSLGFSRPLLVECLESVAQQQPNITLLKGSGVERVIVVNDDIDNNNNTTLQVVLNDESNTTLEASHVIGADGKWSKVRDSFPESFPTTIHSEPSFGVHIMCPSVPEGWRSDGTHVIQPSKENMFYIIAAPIPTGELSVSMVCYDETLERYPWLSPPDTSTNGTNGRGWEEEYSARPTSETTDAEDGSNNDNELADKLEQLLEKELPFFLEEIGVECLETARINRRVSWVELSNNTTNGQVSFATNDGRVALIGDAAHAVVPSQGEGCNLAMQSAASLAEHISPSGETKVPTVEDLSKAFKKYGTSRPQETEPVQLKSAVACRYATRIGG